MSMTTASRSFGYSHKYVHVDLLEISIDVWNNFLTDLITYERRKNGDIPAVLNGGLEVGILNGAPRHLVVDVVVDPAALQILNFTDHIVSTGIRSRKMGIAIEVQYRTEVIDAPYDMSQLDPVEYDRIKFVLGNIMVGNLQIWGAQHGIKIVTGYGPESGGGGGTIKGPLMIMAPETLR